MMLEVTESKDICISCCNKNVSARKISINRDGSSHKGDNIASFSLCRKCLNKLARQFYPYS